MTYSTDKHGALIGGGNVVPIKGDGPIDLAAEFMLAGLQAPDGYTLALTQPLELVRQPFGMPPSASIEGMRAWAQQIIGMRRPDFVIGDDYLRRWYVIPRNPWCNVYLHEIRKSDDDRALHDHPWRNTSIILAGEYLEHLPGGVVVRRGPGDVVEREAEALHRLEIDPGAPPVLSLFVTGPKIRDWGFACPQGWVPWQLFTDPTDSSKTGAGCGEP